MPSTYDQIATTTLGSNTATVTFSSIPQTYTDLVLVAWANCSQGGGVAYSAQFNGNTSTSYVWTGWYTDGSAITRDFNNNYTLARFGLIDNTESATVRTYIYNYANTSYRKPYTSHGGVTYESSYMGQIFINAALTSMDLKCDGGATFTSGSIFSLYGILKA